MATPLIITAPVMLMICICFILIGVIFAAGVVALCRAAHDADVALDKSRAHISCAGIDPTSLLKTVIENARHSRSER